MSKAGGIEVRVSSAGWPYWCDVLYDGESQFSLHHSELRDLRYAADKAMRECKANMRRAVGYTKNEEKEV